MLIKTIFYEQNQNSRQNTSREPARAAVHAESNFEPGRLDRAGCSLEWIYHKIEPGAGPFWHLTIPIISAPRPEEENWLQSTFC